MVVWYNSIFYSLNIFVGWILWKFLWSYCGTVGRYFFSMLYSLVNCVFVMSLSLCIFHFGGIVFIFVSEVDVVNFVVVMSSSLW